MMLKIEILSIATELFCCSNLSPILLTPLTDFISFNNRTILRILEILTNFMICMSLAEEPAERKIFRNLGKIARKSIQNQPMRYFLAITHLFTSYFVGYSLSQILVLSVIKISSKNIMSVIVSEQLGKSIHSKKQLHPPSSSNASCQGVIMQAMSNATDEIVSQTAQQQLFGQNR